MPSFQDSAVIFLLALLLFGPKKLPELARYIGKMMGEFRRASAEFRMQMEDEFRISEQAEQQKKIAAIEAAAPPAPLLHADMPDPEHPHIEPLAVEEAPAHEETSVPLGEVAPEPLEPVAIASAGELNMMPPSTGLPVGRGASSSARTVESVSSLSGAFDSIPHADDPAAKHAVETEAQQHA